MKLGEITPGVEYGALDRPRQGPPRQVTVIEIVTQEEKVWSKYHSGQDTIRKVRKVKVRFLDGRQEDGAGGYSGDAIARAEKGQESVIDRKQLVAKWDDLHDGIKDKIRKNQVKATAQSTTNARIDALLPAKLRKDEYEYDRRVSVEIYEKSQGRAERVSIEARLTDSTLETILALAEYGAHVLKLANGEKETM